MLRAVVNSVFASPLVPRPLRYAVLRLWLVDLRSWRIGPSCFFGGRQIEIGRSTFVNLGCVFDCLAPIRVGDRCHIGMQAALLTSDHRMAGEECRAGALDGRPIVVGDGCWIGARATVLAGVEIGAGCVVGAGALVTSDCEPNGLYVGVPARRIRDLD